MGKVREGGIQLKSPHQANRPKIFNSSRTMVLLRKPGEKISEKGAFTCRALCCFHISDSGTLFLIHSVTRAGNSPTKNTTRQFW